MNVLVFSDSHGKKDNLLTAVDKHPEIDFIIHLGDGAADITDISYLYPEKRIERVCGNCDFNLEYPYEKILSMMNYKIFICHGHVYHVKNGLNTITQKSLNLSADAVLFGHTHRPIIEYTQGVFMLNPGSIGKSTSGKPLTYAILKLTDKGIDAEIKNLF